MGIAEFANLFLKTDPPETASGGYLGLIADAEKRIISRDGMRPEIDLSRSANGWHIFENCWKARGADAGEAVKNNYPNEITAIYRAVNELNKKLLPLKIKVHEFRLVAIGASDLTKM